SLLVSLLRSGFDVAWAADPEMASLVARVSPPGAFVVDGRSSDRPVSDIRAERGALLGGAEPPTIALVCEPGGCGLDVRFDMRQGERGRLSAGQLADVARACAAAGVGVFVSGLGRRTAQASTVSA